MKSIKRHAFRFVVLVLLCFIIWQLDNIYKIVIKIRADQVAFIAHSKFMDRHHYSICDFSNGLDEEGVN